MSRIQILSAQIQTDMNSVIEDLANGLLDTEGIQKALIAINDKIKDWAKEVDSILEV